MSAQVPEPCLIGRNPDGRPRYSCDYDLLDPEINPQVAASNDDADQNPFTGMDVTGTEVQVHSGIAFTKHWGGVRFREGPFPALGSTIDVAYIRVLLYSTSYDDAAFDIFCEDAQRPLCFSTGANNITARVLTPHSVPWDADGLGTGWVNSPSLVDPVQDVVDAHDPASLVFVLVPRTIEFPDPAKAFYFRSWDQSGNVSGAKLHLEWTGASYIEDQPDQSSDDATEIEDPGTVNINWNWAFVYSHADATSRRWAGFRFRNGPFPPKGVTVTEAEIALRWDVQEDANFDIYAEKAAGPATFTVDAGNITDRILTDASVPWAEDGLAPGAWNSSPSIVDVIQELVDAYDSTEIAIILKPKSNATKTLDPVTYNTWSSPCIDPGLMSVKLRIKWVPAAAVTFVPQVMIF